MRRLRKNTLVRDWISQAQLRAEDIILPYFVVEGENIRRPIKSMPGFYHLSADNLLRDISEAGEIKAVLLFGLPKSKDKSASQGYKKSGAVQNAVRAVKKEFKDLLVITDVCLCGYTSHGHCGIIKTKNEKRKTKNYFIDNDATLETLKKIALSHAEAGADFVAPSAMADGQVGAIRGVLDKNKFEDTGILAYSAKYASNFYGPFREALGSSPEFGDRKSYQMDPRNTDEALREIKQDIDEGADIVMVKPALSYLDIICRAKEKFNVPIAAYSVSGEYAMVKEYCKGSRVKGQGSSREREIVLEILTSIKRAGADFIITYWGKDLLKWLIADSL